jgi:hypothetical protein
MYYNCSLSIAGSVGNKERRAATKLEPIIRELDSRTCAKLTVHNKYSCTNYRSAVALLPSQQLRGWYLNAHTLHPFPFPARLARWCSVGALERWLVGGWLVMKTRSAGRPLARL